MIINFFYSNNNQDDWIRFDFKDCKIIPTNYSIKSYNTSKTMKN